MGAVIGFLVHSAAIYTGAKLTKQEQVNFAQCLMVALLSFAAMWIVGFLLAPLSLIPLIGSLVGGAAIWLGTAFAAKYVLNIEWRPALMLGGAVAIIQIVIQMLVRMLFH